MRAFARLSSLRCDSFEWDWVFDRGLGFGPRYLAWVSEEVSFYARIGWSARVGGVQSIFGDVVQVLVDDDQKGRRLAYSYRPQVLCSDVERFRETFDLGLDRCLTHRLDVSRIRAPHGMTRRRTVSVLHAFQLRRVVVTSPQKPTAPPRCVESFHVRGDDDPGLEHGKEITFARPHHEVEVGGVLLHVEQGACLFASNRAHSDGLPVVDDELARTDARERREVQVPRHGRAVGEGAHAVQIPVRQTQLVEQSVSSHRIVLDESLRQLLTVERRFGSRFDLRGYGLVVVLGPNDRLTIDG